MSAEHKPNDFLMLGGRIDGVVSGICNAFRLLCVVSSPRCRLEVFRTGRSNSGNSPAKLKLASQAITCLAMTCGQSFRRPVVTPWSRALSFLAAVPSVLTSARVGLWCGIAQESNNTIRIVRKWPSYKFLQ